MCGHSCSQRFFFSSNCTTDILQSQLARRGIRKASLGSAVAVGFCLAAQLVALCSQLRSQLRSELARPAAQPAVWLTAQPALHLYNQLHSSRASCTASCPASCTASCTQPGLRRRGEAVPGLPGLPRRGAEPGPQPCSQLCTSLDSQLCSLTASSSARKVFCVGYRNQRGCGVANA